jgi:hypothetical protein
MKIQLTPNNFSIASKPPAYFAPQQRQGAVVQEKAIEEVKYAIVDNSFRNYIKGQIRKNPSARKELMAGLREMRAVPQHSKISKRGNVIEIWPAVPRLTGRAARTDQWSTSAFYKDGDGIPKLLKLLGELLEHLRIIDRGPYPPIDPKSSVFIHD